jgi:alpha-tubulin suppressor-like RCC1 family protein
MKKIISFIFVLMIIVPYQLFSQVGINTGNPEGLLHLKNTDKKLGLVVPVVDAADATTTPDGSAPIEATVVYDSLQQCLRIKTSDKWSSCLVDKGGVSNIVNQILAGGNSGIPIKAKKVAAGSLWNMYYIGKDDGYIYGMGYSLERSLGKSDGPYKPSILLAKEAVDISAGVVGGIAVLKNGELWAWGNNTYSKYGLDYLTIAEGMYPYSPISIPTKIPLPQGVKASKVKTGKYGYHTLMLSDQGLLYSAGLNTNYRTGLGVNTDRTNTFSVLPFFNTLKQNTGVTVVDFTIDYSLGANAAITSDGKMYVWGYNDTNSRNLAISSPAGVLSVPVDATPSFPLESGEKIIKVSLDDGGGMVLTSKNKIFGFGNLASAVGLGTGVNLPPTQVVIGEMLTNGTEQIVDIDCGLDGSTVVTNLSVYASGAALGASVLGTGNNNATNTFKKMALSTILPANIRFKQVSMNYLWNLIVTEENPASGDGTVYGAGYGFYNSLGGSVASPQNTPAAVTY